MKFHRVSRGHLYPEGKDVINVSFEHAWFVFAGDKGMGPSG